MEFQNYKSFGIPPQQMKIFNTSIIPRLSYEKREGLGELIANHILKADFIGVDSVRLLSTAKFVNKLQRAFKLEFSTRIPSKRFFSSFDFYTRPSVMSRTKLSDNVSLLIYHSTASNDEARSHKMRLDSRAFLELHGLNQYHANGEQVELNSKTLEMLNFIFQNKKQAKLLSFDFAFDYREQAQICYDYALEKAPFIAEIPNARPRRQTFKTCLYIQKAQIKDGYQEPLTPLIQNIKIYDKQEKNNLNEPLTRLEFCFLA